MNAEHLSASLRAVPYVFAVAWVGLVLAMSSSVVPGWSLLVAAGLGVFSFTLVLVMVRSRHPKVGSLAALEIILVLVTWSIVAPRAGFELGVHHLQFFCTWLAVDTGLVMLFRRKLQNPQSAPAGPDNGGTGRLE